ncbi:hypothetical protein FALCPG4_015772 [Fusarium falciforme]
MPTTYKIYFSNFSGFNNNFAFFSDSPIVVDNGGSPVYGNIVASQYVPADNGDTTFEIDVTKTYYAWTSICKVDTSTLPGRNVETKISNSKLATLGTPGSPGSTFKLIDNGGNPTFDGSSTTYEAPDGSFQISADANAFMPDQNFICGLGSVDGNGQRIPVATFAAQPNTVATITPKVKFYIAQYSATQGTIIDVSILSKQAAPIDFTGKATNAAFVTQSSGGSFNVRYGSAKAMLEQSRVCAAKPNGGLSNAQYQEMAKLIQLLQKNLDMATLYLCKFTWADRATQAEKATAVNTVAATMLGLGYTVTAQPSGPTYTPAVFGIRSNNTIGVVRNAWADAVHSLGLIATDPKTINGSFAENQNCDSNGQGKLHGIEQVNGNGSTHSQSFNENGYDSEQLQEILKSAKRLSGFNVAAC